MATLIGRIEEYDDKEEWQQYVERLSYFFAAANDSWEEESCVSVGGRSIDVQAASKSNFSGKAAREVIHRAGGHFVDALQAHSVGDSGALQVS